MIRNATNVTKPQRKDCKDRTLPAVILGLASCLATGLEDCRAASAPVPAASQTVSVPAVGSYDVISGLRINHNETLVRKGRRKCRCD